MNYFRYILCPLCTTIMLVGCGKKNDKPLVFYDNTEYTAEATNDNIIEVPFVEDGGVKYLDVEIDGVGLKMIIDSGCSSTMISLAEANYLYEKGRLTIDDILGTANSAIADGSIVENVVVRLHNVVIAGQISCGDIEAVVATNTQAPLLLGNGILNRAASYSIDNVNKTIRFHLK